MKKAQRSVVVKAAFFSLFIIFVIVLFRFTPVRDFLNPHALQEWVNSFGNLAPIVFVLLYGIGISLFLPATLFTGIGAIVFGAFWGFLYNITGAMLGASIGFFVGRYFGREFAASLIGEKLQKYDQKIAANGFATILYLRLIFFPFTPLNFGMGLTGISFGAFFAGTFLGIIAGGFAMTFFFATVAEVWASGNWITLVNWKSIVAVVLFVGSFFIPAVVRKLKPVEDQESAKD